MNEAQNYGASAFLTFLFSDYGTILPLTIDSKKPGSNVHVRAIIGPLFSAAFERDNRIVVDSAGRWSLPTIDADETKKYWPSRDPAEIWIALIRLIRLLFDPIDTNSKTLLKSYYEAAWPQLTK